jgi:hypothetical protein
MKKFCYSLGTFLGLLAFAGCARWVIPVQSVDGESGAALPNVKATWIATHRRFLDYKRNTSVQFCDDRGEAHLRHKRNSHQNAIVFELPGYYSASLGISQRDPLLLHLTSPVQLTRFPPWWKTDAEREDPSPFDKKPYIERDLKIDEGVISIPLFRRPN